MSLDLARLGVTLPNHHGVADPLDLIALARFAEDAGVGSVWVGDHLAHVGYVGQRLGDAAYHHPLATLAFVAAATSRIRLGTSVLVAPFRNPFDVAKHLATLDHLSRGRLIAGFGAGSLEPEFDVLGLPFADRGRITDEFLAVLAALWSPGAASHRGVSWNFRGVRTSPKPVQTPLPIWVGGSSTRARRRAGRLAHGWQAMRLEPADFAAGCEAVLEAATGAGRDPGELTMSYRMEVFVRPAPDEPRPGSLTLDPADPSAVRRLVGDRVREYHDSGADHVLLSLETGDLGAHRQLLTALG